MRILLEFLLHNLHLDWHIFLWLYHTRRSVEDRGIDGTIYWDFLGSVRQYVLEIEVPPQSCSLPSFLCNHKFSSPTFGIRSVYVLRMISSNKRFKREHSFLLNNNRNAVFNVFNPAMFSMTSTAHNVFVGLSIFVQMPNNKSINRIIFWIIWMWDTKNHMKWNFTCMRSTLIWNDWPRVSFRCIESENETEFFAKPRLWANFGWF